MFSSSLFDYLASKNYSLTLKQIRVPIWSRKNCEIALKRMFGGLNLPSMSSILCAGSVNQDACIGKFLAEICGKLLFKMLKNYLKLSFNLDSLFNTYK